jgi:hypothetical protein
VIHLISITWLFTCERVKCLFMDCDRPWFMCRVAARNYYVETVASVNVEDDQPDSNVDNNEFDAGHSDADDNEGVGSNHAVAECNDLTGRHGHQSEPGDADALDDEIEVAEAGVDLESDDEGGVAKAGVEESDDEGGVAEAGVDADEPLQSPSYLTITRRGSDVIIHGSLPPSRHKGWVLVNSTSGYRTLPMSGSRRWQHVRVTLPAIDDFISVAHWFERGDAQSGCITRTYSLHNSRPVPSLKRKRQ